MVLVEWRKTRTHAEFREVGTQSEQGVSPSLVPLITRSFYIFKTVTYNIITLIINVILKRGHGGIL